MANRCLRALTAAILALLGVTVPACSQAFDETLGGPDGREVGQGPHGHMLGDWGGGRTRLAENGVDFDLQYISDFLWNIESQQRERIAGFDRVRGTVDINFGTRWHQEGLYLHATALWQGGGELGNYLGLLTGPSSLSSANTFRLDSWWLEKRMRNGRIVVRAGQFAGQDFYGSSYYGSSFIFEPIGYALGNLGTTFETFDPPSTPAVELRVAPARHFYVKSMVMAGDRYQYAHNPTGLVPQFRGAPVSASEIGFSPGKEATSVRALDTVAGRRGYSGLYQFGASYNPGKFAYPGGRGQRSGNYLLYWMASQALWRVDPQKAKGFDATLAYDWSPVDVNRNNRVLTAGLRFNEPLPFPFHNTLSLGYVRSMLSPQFASADKPWRAEEGIELNGLFAILPMMFVQPVVQYYANAGGGTQRAVVFGFRTKVEF